VARSTSMTARGRSTRPTSRCPGRCRSGSSFRATPATSWQPWNCAARTARRCWAGAAARALRASAATSPSSWTSLKYMNRLLELHPDRQTAWVEPGVICDQLRDAAEAHHLTLAPDPAAHAYCTLGGMTGNNACGVHTVMGGKTDDNAEELEILTYDGLRVRVGATSDADLERITREGGLRGEIYAGLRALRNRYADSIRRKYPRIPRRVSGYNLDDLLPSAPAITSAASRACSIRTVMHTPRTGTLGMAAYTCASPSSRSVPAGLQPPYRAGLPPASRRHALPVSRRPREFCRGHGALLRRRQVPAAWRGHDVPQFHGDTGRAAHDPGARAPAPRDDARRDDHGRPEERGRRGSARSVPVVQGLQGRVPGLGRYGHLQGGVPIRESHHRGHRSNT
jgi:hypothetical protein